MQFHGIGNEEHSAHVHHVTECMHNHAHYKIEADASRAAASSAAKVQSQQTAAQQSEGQLSLSAWLDKHLSRGKGLLKGFWNGGEAVQVKEAGENVGKEQVLAQIDQSREMDSSGQNTGFSAGDSHPKDSSQTDLSQAVHLSQAAQAAAPTAQSQRQDASEAVTVAEEESRQEGIWRKIRVRFKDIAGQLTGHLRGNTSKFQAKRSFQAKQVITREEPSQAVKSRKDAVEIKKYHVEESYLLDSYDRKGGYRKLSTKK